MTFKLILFIISSIIVTQIAGQDACIPQVVDVALPNGVLIWDDSPDEACEISYYIVTVQGIATGTNLMYRVTEKSLDLTFLPVCEQHMFTVQQVSTDGLLGLPHTLFTITPPPPDADFTLEYLSLIQMPSWVEIEWALKEEWQVCASHYRVLIYDEDRDLPEDSYLYSITRFPLTYLSPCTPYTIGVTAMYNIEQEGPPKVIRYRAADVGPEVVVDLALSSGVLAWDDSPNEACEINYYIVTVQSMATGREQIYRVTEKSLDLTSLPVCEQHMFRVQQVSTHGLLGLSHFLFTITPPPPDVDFTLEYLSLIQMSSWVEIEWALKEEWHACATHYRVLIYDEDRDLPEDMYFSTNRIPLNYLSPCTPYTIGVTAMYNVEQEGPPKVIRHRAADVASVAPALRRLNVHSTSIEMTWDIVDQFVLNRCPIRSINIDASPYFAIAYPVQDDPDSRRPFTVTVPGLIPNTMYYMNVTATNSGGVSPGITLLVQTLESD